MSSIEVPLTQGKVAVIDAADYEKVAPYKWRALKTRTGTYAVTEEYLGFYDKTIVKRAILMHRLVMDAGPNEDVDHIDKDTLNNQRANLRRCTRQQNIWANGPISRENRTSSFKGVSYRPNHAGAKKWLARVARKHIGYYATEIEAAVAYNEAAKAIYGDFAYQNKVVT